MGQLLSIVVIAPSRKYNFYRVTIESRLTEGIASQLNELIDSAGKRVAENYRSNKVAFITLQIEALTEQLSSVFVLQAESQVKADIQKELVTLKSRLYMLDYSKCLNAVTVIKNAVDPSKPFEPKRQMLMVLFFVLGGIFGVFIVFIREGVRSYQLRQQSTVED